MIFGITEVEPGYFEFRMTWNGHDLLAMDGATLDKFKACMAGLESLDINNDAADEPQED